jgi:hypothetical protein
MAEFLTLPEELLEVAEVAVLYFEGFGYDVEPETSDVEYPYTPALRCRRESTTLFVEIATHVDRDRVKEWSAYCRSCSKDTRAAIVLPSDVDIGTADLALSNELGIGMYQTIDDSLRELLSPVDLAVQFELPQLTRYPNKVRKRLGSSFEQVRRGNWLEGFEEACVALETVARSYLASGVSTGRLTMSTSTGKDSTPSAKKIESMTLGQLKDQFLSIDNPNHADSLVGQSLQRLNPDRIRAAHKRKHHASQAALRRNVGKQMWLITNALKELV